jgi:hypothetical protein
VSLEPVPADPEVGVVVPPIKEMLPEPVLGSAVAIFPGVIVLKFHWVMISPLATSPQKTTTKLSKKQRLIITVAPVTRPTLPSSTAASSQQIHAHFFLVTDYRTHPNSGAEKIVKDRSRFVHRNQ